MERTKLQIRLDTGHEIQITGPVGSDIDVASIVRAALTSEGIACDEANVTSFEVGPAEAES